MRNELTFGQWVFPSQQAAKRECESRFRRYHHGDYIGGEDRAFFLALFEERYPDFCESFYGNDDPDLAEKPSLKVIQWNRFSPRFDTPKVGIMAVREDGSWSPLSWRLAVDTASHSSWVIAAARRIVTPQWGRFLADHKARVGNVSSLSGPTDEELVAGYQLRSFYELFRKWREIAGVTERDIVLRRNGRTSVSFEDEELAESWADYHREHARLVAVTQIEYRTTKPSEALL